MAGFVCPYCGVAKRSFSKLLGHIKFIHSQEPNFSITCADCGQSFRKFASFKSHLQRKRKRNANGGDCAHPHGNINVIAEPGWNEDNEDGDDNGEEIQNQQQDIDNMTRFLALFILKTKEENQLNQQTINAIIENSEELVEVNLEELKQKVRSCLTNNGIEIEDVEGLADVLEERSLFSRAKEPLANEYLQLKYFLENLDFVEPEEIILSQHIEYRMVNGHQKFYRVKEAFHYIPILKTLKNLLNQPDVLEQVYNSHNSEDGTLGDFCDGEDFKDHELFGQDPRALVLHCYFDEYQVTNPLGAKTKKHKIGAFYFILGNINPIYRSVINGIQLVALCRVPLISKHGLNSILVPFIRDIKLLEAEHGVSFEIEGQERHFRGSIGPYTNDNLGAHAVGGFLESFSSLRICRFCMATKDDIQTKFSETEFQLRTKANHDRHCDHVRDDPTLSTAYGVKRHSLLNESRYFHVIGGLDVDIMHDQLEGVLPLEIKMILKKFVQEENLFTMEELNARIERYTYGTIDSKNKPSPIKPQQLATNTASLSQSAAQMWCLARMFPMIVGDLVPDGDNNWENFLTLLQIEELVFAPKTSARMAAYLGLLIAEYLEQFKELYERDEIPKQHFMVHYPRQIVKRGPLVRHWAMRFEAKHNYFKKLVDKVNNFKNITYSLAKRHQALQTYLLQSSNGNYLRLSLEVGPGRKVTVLDAQLTDDLCHLDERISEDSELIRTSWVKLYGTKYTKGCVVAIKMHHGNPVFGEIHESLVVNGRIVVFKYKKMTTREYVSHVNGYRVTTGQEVAYIKQEDLQDFHPLGLHKGFGCYAVQNFVVLRYRIDCME